MNSKIYTAIVAAVTLFVGINPAYAKHDHASLMNLNSYEHMVLTPGLNVNESTINPNLSEKERYQAMLRASVKIHSTTRTDFTASGIKNGGLGSGGILDNKKCLIFTNNHVVTGGNILEVEYTIGFTQKNKPLKKRVPAKLIGTPSAEYDLAVLQAESCETTFWMPLENSDKVSHGDTVTIVGNPRGMTDSFSHGIVSNPEQSLPGNIAPFIQTDASINPGNSGGPMFNDKGYVIGVNAQIFSSSGGNQGLGFSIPSNILALYLRNNSLYSRMIMPRFGVEITPVSDNHATALGITDIRKKHYKAEYLNYNGVRINNFSEGTLAKKTLMVGDIILDFNHEPIASSSDLISGVRKVLLKTPANVRVLREDKLLDLKVPLADASVVKASEKTKGADPYTAESYDNYMGWNLEVSPSKYNDVDYPVIANAAMLSPAFKNLFLSKPEITGGETKESAVPNAVRPILLRSRIPVPTWKIKKANFIAVKAVKSAGESKLDLSTIDPSDRIEYLENYVAAASVEKRPVIIEIVLYISEKITDRSEIKIPDVINDVSFQGRIIPGEEIKKMLEKIKNVPAVTNESKSLWIDIFPKAFDD